MRKNYFKNWKIIYWRNYSNHDDCVKTEKISIEQFEQETKKFVLVETEPTKEELEEQEIQEVEKSILRKQALELLWKDTTQIEAELQSKTIEITKEETTTK